MHRICLALVAVWMAFAAQASERADYLDMARRGWSYELRSTMVGRDMSIPVRIHGRAMAGAALCLVGERPHPDTTTVLETFRALIAEVYGRPLPMRYAGLDADGCGSGRVVVLRLFSGAPPNRALTRDLAWLNSTYGLGLPSGRDYSAVSPAMAQTFFGRRGLATHIMVQQPGALPPGRLERKFYRSILVEELFQAFTFGMDVLQFDTREQFMSKLQERPFNPGRLPWASRSFMRAMLESNPGGLCRFDVFMLHAVARSPLDETNTPDFIQFIETHFESLRALGSASFADPRFAPILDPACRAEQS